LDAHELTNHYYPWKSCEVESSEEGKTSATRSYYSPRERAFQEEIKHGTRKEGKFW